MAIVLDGTNGINTPNTFALKNRVINGGFILNQRGYVTNTALTSGSYGHDRFKGGSSGCTYTFTQGSTGVNTTITITAGSLQQVIEGANMPEGGSYTLSWTGTAQGKIAGGSFAASPIIATGLTAGANCTIEFNTGTCTNVQVEAGSIQTSFDYRPFGTELALCQRYFEAGSFWREGTNAANGNFCVFSLPFLVQKRANATFTYGNVNGANAGVASIQGVEAIYESISPYDQTNSRTGFAFRFTTNNATSTIRQYFTASAEL